jgi:hypothetical protein
MFANESGIAVRPTVKKLIVFRLHGGTKELGRDFNNG